jgi:hypothetical protein
VSSSNRAFHSVPSAFTVSGLMPLRIISLVLRFEVTRAITQSKNLRAHYARGCGSRSLHCPHMLDSRAQSMSPAVRPSFEVTTSGGLTGMRQRVPGADTGRPAAKKVTQCHRCRCSPAAAAPPLPLLPRCRCSQAAAAACPADAGGPLALTRCAG